MGQPESPAEPGHALDVELERVARGELAQPPGVRAGGPAVAEHVGQLAEVVLEPAGRDHLDDPALRVARVPERVPLPAWLEHPRAGTGLDDPLAEERPERPLDDERVLVLVAMTVERRSERPRRDRVLDDGEAALGLVGLDLPDDSEPPEVEAVPVRRRDRHALDRRRWDCVSSRFLLFEQRHLLREYCRCAIQESSSVNTTVVSN